METTMLKTVTAALATLLLSGYSEAQETDLDAIAFNIVSNSANVQPGEIVLIRGSIETLDIFEAIVAQTLIAGGQPIPYIEFPAAVDKAIKEAPLEYLRLEHTAELSLMEDTDVFISVTAGFNPAAFLSSDIPRERRLAAQQGRASFFDAAGKGAWREVYVGQSSGVPTQSFADYSNANFAQFKQIFYEALTVEPSQLEASANRLQRHLVPGAQVHITGPKNTDLVFNLSDEPVKMTYGQFPEEAQSESPAQVYLPAGEIAACVDPASANGTLYIPSYMFRAEEIRGLTLIFKDGVIADFMSEGNENPFREFIESLDTPSLALSLINIGLNPYSRISPGSNYRSWEMGGLVTAFLGDNTLYQCGHVAGNRIHPHIEGLTMEIAGNPVIVDGEIESKGSE